MSNTKLTIGLVVAIVIAIAGLFFPQVKHLAGAISSSDIQSSNFTEVSASTGIVSPLFQLGGNTAASSIQQQVSTGSCNTGVYAGSSTLFAFANPNAATSTLRFQISGSGQATSSTLLVGTSTLSTGITPANVSATLINVGLSTSTSYQMWSGILVGGLGYLSPGAATFREIVVGPNDVVVGEATTTVGGAQAAGYVPGLSCTYKGIWSL